MLLRKSNEKLEKEREYEAMLAETRKQAFQERKQLEKNAGISQPRKWTSSSEVGAQPKRTKFFQHVKSGFSTDAILKIRQSAAKA